MKKAFYDIVSLRSWQDAAEPPYSLHTTLHQSSHGLATQTKALAREIPPATQATTLIETVHAFNTLQIGHLSRVQVQVGFR